MTIVKTSASFALLAILTAFATPATARADEPKVRISFGAGVTAGAIDGSAAWGGSVGYRFADRLSFDVEVTAVDKPADRFANRYFSLGNQGNQLVTGMARVGNIVAGPSNQRGGQFGPATGAQLPVGPNFSANTGGNTLLGTMGFRYELPSQDARFRPYLSAGFGVARTEETFRVAIAAPAAPTPGRGGAAPAAPVSNTIINQDRTHTGLLVGAGGGASVRLVAQLSVDVDARYYRLDRGRNLGRFGAGLSYRF